MRDSLKLFIIRKDAIIQKALEQINTNRKGFLVVLDEDDKLEGVLTDGDIRRGLIDGVDVLHGIQSVYTKKAKTVLFTSDFLEVTVLFKNEAIKFLPIVDKENRLVNIITKSEMHTLLLQDIQVDLLYDFQALDEELVTSEIFQKPWGFYKTTVMNAYFQSKIISVRPKECLSLQAHKHREEHWIVVHGNGKVQIEESVFNVSCGSTVFIPKGARHRLSNIDDVESLIITEVQIGDYLGEDDIIRYEDIYGRMSK